MSSQDTRYSYSQTDGESLGSQDTYSNSQRSNSWDLNDSFVNNNSQVTESQYSTSESEYSGWSSGTSQSDNWQSSQSTTYDQSSQGTIVLDSQSQGNNTCSMLSDYDTENRTMMDWSLSQQSSNGDIPSSQPR